MPCDNLAVQRLKLTADVPAELLASPAGLEALRLKLQAAAGDGAQVSLTIYPLNSEAPTYGKFLIRTSSGQTAEAAVYTEATYAHGGGKTKTGAMQVWGASRALVKALTEATEPVAGTLAQKLAQRRGIDALKKKYRQRAPEVRTAAGATILKLTI
jgi:hypothetical protein